MVPHISLRAALNQGVALVSGENSCRCWQTVLVVTERGLLMKLFEAEEDFPV